MLRTAASWHVIMGIASLRIYRQQHEFSISDPDAEKDL
jgi:hypothetical protein